MGFFTRNFVFLVTCLLSICADEHNHIYEEGDEVLLWMGLVGPSHKPREVYPFYSFSFCKGPKDIINHKKTILEALRGSKLEFSGVDIRFKVNVTETDYCQIYLSNYDSQTLAPAIKEQYRYRMYLDNLPIEAVLGEVDQKDGDSYLWTHKKFDIGYNGNQIVEANLTYNESRAVVTPGALYTYSYEVNWIKSSVKFEDRLDKYGNLTFFEYHNIRDNSSL